MLLVYFNVRIFDEVIFIRFICYLISFIPIVWRYNPNHANTIAILILNTNHIPIIGFPSIISKTYKDRKIEKKGI